MSVAVKRTNRWCTQQQRATRPLCAVSRHDVASAVAAIATWWLLFWEYTPALLYRPMMSKGTRRTAFKAARVYGAPGEPRRLARPRSVPGPTKPAGWSVSRSALRILAAGNRGSKAHVCAYHPTDAGMRLARFGKIRGALFARQRNHKASELVCSRPVFLSSPVDDV